MFSEFTIFLISLLSFLLPTQLGLHFDSLQTTVYGFKIDYLIPTIYLTDLVAWLIIILGIRKIKFNKKYLVYSMLYVGFVLSNILVSSYLVPSVYKWLKVTELVLLGMVILNSKKFNIYNHFIKPLSYSISIVCVLGIMQFFSKSSIGGVFYLLGERTLNFSDPNVSPFPYSSFSHPNSFAGFLLIFAIFLIQFKNKFNQKYFWFLVFIVLANLILTNSLNVYITIFILVFFKFRSNLSFAFLTPALPAGGFDFSQRFITHRLELIKASFQMIKENFLMGVGLNNFTPNLPRVTNTFLNAWELQPVHNIFLLVFSEIGIVGFMVFCFVVFSNVTAYAINYSLLAVILTGLSDHYWLTLQQNMLLFTYVLVISYKWKKKK